MKLRVIPRVKAERIRCSHCQAFLKTHPEVSMVVLSVTGCIQEDETLALAMREKVEP